MIDIATALRTFGLAADPRVWLILAVMGFAVFGRAGFFRSKWFNLIKPWRNTPPGHKPGQAVVKLQDQRSPLRDPLFLFLLVISASAVVAWIVMSWTVSTQHAR